MSTLSAHQPHFLPWPSYFLKILRSDVFIILDDVQFRKNYFQNRCEILDIGFKKKQWLTLPIKKKISSKSIIKEIPFAEKFHAKDILLKLELSYRGSPFYEEVYADLKNLFVSLDTSLCAFNINSILWCMEMLNIQTEVVISSSINIPFEQNPTQKLINLCLHHDATSYLSGPGGRNYMDLCLFQESEINVLWHDSKDINLRYKQSFSPFIPNLSILDMFFNVGYERSASILNCK